MENEFIPVSSNESDQFNKMIRAIEDSCNEGSDVDYPIWLEDTGKAFPYYGWYWRDVNFTRPILLAKSNNETCGFCENNKWDYPMFTLSEDEYQSIIECLREMSKSKDKVPIIRKFQGIINDIGIAHDH